MTKINCNVSNCSHNKSNNCYYNIVNITGVDFPDNLSEYKLIIHCGACMFTRRQLLSRLEHVKEQNIPITNFGVALAELNGILDRSCNFLLNSKS